MTMDATTGQNRLFLGRGESRSQINEAPAEMGGRGTQSSLAIWMRNPAKAQSGLERGAPKLGGGACFSGH